MSGFLVYATIGGVGPVLCGVRAEHRWHPHECFKHPTKQSAESFADYMRRLFPENQYMVREST